MSSISYPVSRPRFSIEQAFISLLIGLLIFFLSLFIFIIGTQGWYAGRIFPGVRVAGIDVGGISPQDAAKRIAEGVTFPDQGKILIRDGQRIWVATPAQLGLFLDPQTSARSAYQVGRSSWIVDRLRAQFYAWYIGHNLPPDMIYDQRITYAYLTSLAKEIDKPTIEASLDLKGTDVVVHSGQVGRTVDIQKNLVLLSLQLQTLHDGVIDLLVKDSAPVILDPSKQAELARKMLSQPLTITMPEQEANQAGPWTIDPATLATMLTFERVAESGSTQYQVRLNSEQLRSYLIGLAPSLSRTPQNARFTFNDDSHELEVIQSAVIGREIDIDNSMAAIQEKMYSGEHTIPLVISYTNPPVIDQTRGEEIGVRELVHSETSYFYGSSAARVQNIEAASAKFHGLMVAPGETFSMASAIGDITLDNGFAEALIIVGGQTVKGVGGGVCQVSTTLFRTAFFAGYPIVERHAHAYRVYYYEKVAGNRIDTDLAGLDATVFVPIVDFKFVNDTPNWLLMETYVNPSSSSLTWKFYSTSDNRRVEWKTTGATNIVPAPDPLYRENPDLPNGTIKQVDWEADGADVTVNRTVYRNDEVYLQDTIYTHYEPWQNVFEYGPGTQLPTDEPPPD
ncbi:MAG: VanW family protein [Anaerolineaceae bacterium]|nr:VanW family protein [Anaerolineaceae bacterium]